MNAPSRIDANNYIPHSISLEQQVIGAVLTSNDIWYACSDLVEAEHFFEPIHAKFWQMLTDQITHGKTVTFPALIAMFGKDADIDLQGLTVGAYVARLASEATTVRLAPDMARQIRQLWARRQLISLAREVQDQAMGVDGADIDGLLEHADQSMAAIRFGRNVAGVERIGALAEQSVRQTADSFELDGKAGLDTGIGCIDEVMGPLMPGDMVTVLAPSGHGKSALGAQLLVHNAKPSLDANRNAPGAFFSMEMEGVQIARRTLATYTGVAARAQKAGEINQAEYETLRSTAASFSNMPLYIDGSGRQKVSTVIKKMRAMHRTYKLKMAVVDHVKLFKPESARQNKFEVIETAAMELKDVAKELGMVVVLLAQVTRESQKRDGWRVKASDLWGGDVVKECSDHMLTVCLPHKWLTENEPDMDKDKGKWAADLEKWQGYAEIGFAKLRDGEGSGYRKVAFDGKRMLFSERG